MTVTLFHGVVAVRQLGYYRRLRQPVGDLLADSDPRRPVLLLQSFALDSLPLSSLEQQNSYSWLHLFGWLDQRTFEDRLTEAFADVGPVIAIGRPGEAVQPLGAAREYADEDSWRDAVLNRARTAQLVLMLVDGTPGMEWELEHIPSVNGLRRIVLVLPPRSEVHDTRSSAWYARWEVLRGRFAFLPAVDTDVVAVLFDEDGRPVVVRPLSQNLVTQLTAAREAWTPPSEADGLS